MLIVRQKIFSLKQTLRSWQFSLILFTLTALFAIVYAITSIKTVSIVDNGVSTLVRTTETDHVKILQAEGIDYRLEDKVSFSGITGGSGKININRSFPITLRADGNEEEIYVLGGTVFDTLKEASIEYKDEDLINVSLGRTVNENDLISIKRVDTEVEVIKQVIPHEVVVTPSNVVPQGTIDVISLGSVGEIEKVFSHKYIDGTLVETTLVKEEVTKEPETEMQLKGTIDAQSPFDPFDGIELDDEGRPSNAVQVLTNQVATAYSARSGAKTSTGRYAIIGHVAVNPSVIPYGSKLFIETSTGGLVYGYAIAADTGTALLDGRVDVDLYFNTTAECRRFGRRSVNIYILP